MAITYVYHIPVMICRVKLKQLIIILSAICIFIVLSILHLEPSSHSDYNVSQPVSIRYEPIEDESMDVGRRSHPPQIRNVFFLKVHKCASSTVQNILMRYGQNRNLNFVLPYRGNYLGHPDFLDISTHALPLAQSDGSINYNVLCHHCRFSENGLQRDMPSDTIYLAIVRDPVDLFESLYSYGNLAEIYEMSLEKFVAMPKWWFTTTPRVNKRIGCNQMAFDFGLSESDFMDDSIIEEAVRRLEARFDLIMVVEYFDESIVLMKNLLGLDVQDVVYFMKNKRFSEERHNMTEATRRQIREANWVDQKLYDHFVNIFKQKVQNFGNDQMRVEVNELHQWNGHWFRTCGVRFSRNDDKSLPTAFRQISTKVQALTLDDQLMRTKGHDYAEFCETLAIAELPFTNRLRTKHIELHGTWLHKFLNWIGFYDITLV